MDTHTTMDILASSNRSWTSTAGRDLTTSNNSSNLTTILAAIQTISYFELVVHGFLISLLGFFGLIGNLFSFYVFSRPSMRNSINCFFMGLTIIDMFVITSAILMFSLPIMQAYLDLNYGATLFDIYQIITPFVYPIGMIAQSASVYLTVFITLERYLVVCQPLKSRTICTYRRALKCVIVIVVCSTLYNTSRFFEYEYIAVDNETAFLQSTALRQNDLYISIYINWLYMIFMYIIPFTVLIVVNSKIILEMRAARKTRSRMNATQCNEESASIMLLVIVCIFMICNAPAMVLNIMETLEFPAPKLAQISNALVVFNSSFAFVIYTTFCKKFRRILKALGTCRQNTVINLPLDALRATGAHSMVPGGGITSGDIQSIKFRRNVRSGATLNIKCECGNLDLVVIARAPPSKSPSPATFISSAQSSTRRAFFQHMSTEEIQV